MAEKQISSSRTRLLVGSALILCGAFGWMLLVSEPQALTTAELTDLIALKNTGIALLENTPNKQQQQGVQAAEAFTEIAAKLPLELLGHRNLVIARLLMLEKDREKEDEFPQQYKNTLLATKAALKNLYQHDPESGVTEILDAKLSELLNDQPGAIKHYRAAVKLRPEDSVLQSEIFMLLRNHPDADVRAAAIRDATEDRLDNLVLLETLVRLQAESRDEQLLESLDALLGVLTPFAVTLSSHTIDVVNELPNFKQRLADGEEAAWNDTRTRLIQIFNVMRQEFGYQSDLFQLQRHILEYVIDDYSDTFYQRAALTTNSDLKPVAVTFTALPENKQPSHQRNVIDIAICDFDLDRKNDLVLLTTDELQVFKLTDNSGNWELIIQQPVKADMQHILIADFDRDTTALTPEKFSIADVDILTYGKGGYQFFENRLAEETQQRRLIPVDGQDPILFDTTILRAVVTDIENDGDLDIAAITDSGLKIIQNRENWDFVDSTAGSVSFADKSKGTTAVAAVDFNRNLQTDILTPGGRFENVRHGRFSWHAPQQQLFPDGPINAITTCDADSNGSWDLVTVSDAGITLTLTENQPGTKTWVLKTVGISSTPTEAVATWDYDNDGLTDILAWGSAGVHVHRATGAGRFAPAKPLPGIPAGAVSQCAIGDLDDDGDLDLVVISRNVPLIMQNDGGNKNNWLRLRLCAEPDPKFKVQRCNVYGIGSRIELRAGNSYQQQTAAGQVIHFGIGKQTTADALRVLWTNGIPQNVVRPETRLTVTEKQELLKGSCPYLYTWTGERYEFFTDLLWAAPIGLQFAEGVIAPTRAIEHLLIPGERLQAVDGEYRLQVTEELWEAAYFDELDLIAVDHPVNTSVFSAEKVGTPTAPTLHIHSFQTARLRSPVAARGSNGDDVLELINKQDGHYTRLFDHRHKQGITDEYYLELDLGDICNAKKVQLILTGWVFPTDTSINIALSQNQKLSGSRPPSIWVPQPNPEKPAAVQWIQTVPSMGFPGGKTKTIVVDVPVEHFTKGDYRIRIVTNMELYWDSIEVAVDLPAQNTMQSSIELLSADLHYRGYSTRLSRLNHGPERYDYEQVATTAFWVPMAGYFTRYGDVTSLMNKTDDQLVVLGSGDEMTLRFAELPDPPPGWKRDFIIRSVGWDKDADLNTVAGHQVEPLPFTKMRSYPPGPDEQPPDSQSYRDYLQRYQTRKLPWKTFWNHIRLPREN